MNVMLLMLLCFPVVPTEAAKYHQDDYTIKVEIVELVDYNRSYIRNATLGLVHYNRTYRAVNGSFYLLKDLSMNIKAEEQYYKFLSNEYRFFPITASVNVCSELVRDMFGVKESLQKFVNVNLACPFKKGAYRMTYGMLNFTQFPPFIPKGRYKNVLKLYDNLNFLVEVHLYAAVEEVMKIWKK